MRIDGSEEMKKTKYVAVIVLVVILVTMAILVKGKSLNKFEKQYKAYLKNTDFSKDFFMPDSIRYAFVYVDEDDVPEMILSDNDSHAATVSLYRLGALGSVQKICELSTYGALNYIPKKNRIFSQYGNQGLFMDVYNQINSNGTLELVDCYSTDGSGIRSDEILYFHGCYAQDVPLFGKPVACERISEEAFEQAQQLLDVDSLVTVAYKDMSPLNELK